MFGLETLFLCILNDAHESWRQQQHLDKKRTGLSQQLLLKIEIGEAHCTTWNLLCCMMLVERMLETPILALHVSKHVKHQVVKLCNTMVACMSCLHNISSSGCHGLPPLTCCLRGCPDTLPEASYLDLVAGLLNSSYASCILVSAWAAEKLMLQKWVEAVQFDAGVLLQVRISTHTFCMHNVLQIKGISQNSPVTQEI